MIITQVLNAVQKSTAKCTLKNKILKNASNSENVQSVHMASHILIIRIYNRLRKATSMYSIILHEIRNTPSCLDGNNNKGITTYIPVYA